MTIDDLIRILIACSGESDADLGGDILDVPFTDLGYDSLAMLESSVQIEKEFGVRVPEDRVAALETPRELLDLVNEDLVGSL
jgi:act minimal PKS acyl carrier protein